MNLKFFLFRLAAIVTAFMLGVGFFDAAQYLQSFFLTPESATVQPQQETSFVPPRVVPSPLVEPTPYVVTGTFPASKENTEAEIEAEGDYYIIDDLPKGFKEFDSLTIITRDFTKEQSSESYDTQIPPKGYVLANKEFNFTRINIANKQIAFETETKKGISYKFAGEFIDEDQQGYEHTMYVVLRGRLTKMRDGKKIAESKVSFAMGGC